jgi:tRNA (guanine-N7-)-methyltransferase
MRVRKKKNGDARFEACKDLYIEFDKNAPEKLDLSALFPGYTRFCAEIGCGKGSFITETARRNPDIAFIAVEKVRDVVIFASEKVKEAELPNVLFICGDAAALSAMIEPKTLETIYINFCDPWPKARHAKRRLTSEGFLKLFKELLSDDGKIEFKTDNIGLFEYSLEEFPKAGFEMRNVCFDLHASELAESNVQTEYEKNFSAKGFKINRLEGYKAKN